MTQPGDPIQHVRLASDRPIVKPSSMTEAECGTLHVRDKVYAPSGPSGRTFPEMLSRWSPTEEQRALLAAGHDVYLSCVGSHPPVLLYVGDPDGLDQPPPPVGPFERRVAVSPALGAPYGARQISKSTVEQTASQLRDHPPSDPDAD